jgi:hypothetical protein
MYAKGTESPTQSMSNMVILLKFPLHKVDPFCLK